MNKLQINEYCTQISGGESTACLEATRIAKQIFPGHARMISGGVECSFLKFLITTHNIKNILEIGTFVGYSSTSMAEALPDDGQIITVDLSTPFVDAAKKVWKLSPHASKIKSKMILGKDFFKTNTQLFDLIFIDADKNSYIDYFELGLQCLSPNGIIAIDNALWSGAVLEENPESPKTKTIKMLNEIIRDREDLVSTLLPIRDGLHLVSRRKQTN